MKISLIAVLAAIAGCALATRGPLYARALEQVNSFERDLDVYPRESGVAVQARDLKPPPYAGTLVHITGHNTAARYQQRAARKNEKAAKAAHKLSQKTTGEASQMWKDMAADRRTMAEAHVVDWKSHHDAMISGPHEGTPLVRSSIREASKSIAEAEYVYSMAKVHGERLQNASQAASKSEPIFMYSITVLVYKQFNKALVVIPAHLIPVANSMVNDLGIRAGDDDSWYAISCRVILPLSRYIGESLSLLLLSAKLQRISEELLEPLGRTVRSLSSQ